MTYNQNKIDELKTGKVAFKINFDKFEDSWCIISTAFDLNTELKSWTRNREKDKNGDIIVKQLTASGGFHAYRADKITVPIKTLDWFQYADEYIFKECLDINGFKLTNNQITI